MRKGKHFIFSISNEAEGSIDVASSGTESVPQVQVLPSDYIIVSLVRL